MLADICRKLEEQLNVGITTESQVVYLMAAIRKILEQTGMKKQYPDLVFHCDWVVHSKLTGRAAQAILEQFDAANIHLKAGIDLQGVPTDLRHEIDRISQMESFKGELERFLGEHNLPALDKHRPDGWIHFLHLYVQVVQDCPLEVVGQGAATISKVVVQVELATQPVGDEMPFKVRWIVHDRNGLTGEIFILNSFSLNPKP